MSLLVQIVPFIIMIAIFYLIIFLPENKRKKKYTEMLNNLKVNDEIITKGGIVGKIINIQDRYIILQTGPDRARIKLDKGGVLNRLSSAETVKENPEVETVEKTK